MLRPRVREDGTFEQVVVAEPTSWSAGGAAAVLEEVPHASVDPLFGRTDKYLPLPPAAAHDLMRPFAT